MYIPLSYVELHNPMFLAGTNLGLKLDPQRRTGLELVYDRTEKELLVWWNGYVSIVPVSNVANMCPKNVTICDTAKIVVDLTQQIPIISKNHGRFGKLPAQVSTPTSHALAGLGEGK